MANTLQELVTLLDLEPIEHNIYRGNNRDIGSGRIFGGQVLAQALIAAQRTLDDDERSAHSVHGYFILAGDLSIPVVYFVDRLRDGRSYTTRRVTAIQHGRAIFNMAASFHRHEDGPSHQASMPDVPGPEDLSSELDILRDRQDRIPPHLRTLLTQDRPLEFRPAEPWEPFDPTPAGGVRHTWVKTTGSLSGPLIHHQAVLAYASDYGLLGSALAPLGKTVRDIDVMAASLDHAIWFHRPVRVDEWLLYAKESQSLSGGRGFSRGSFFSRAGELVASVAQEGVLRIGRRRAKAGNGRT